MADRSYSRKYLRVKPNNPLYADITIVQIGLRTVVTGAACVRILNISPGGLMFVSSLKIPADDSVMLGIHFSIAGQEFRLKGHITYRSCVEVNENEYGFCFKETDEKLRACLKGLFNNMSVKIEKHIVYLKFNI